MAAPRRRALASPAACGGLAVAWAFVAGVAGCPRNAAPPRAAAGEAEPEVPATAPARPPAYVIADPDALSRGRAIALDQGMVGVIFDGSRVVIRAGEARAAEERRDDPLTSVERIPVWLGGGYLFHTQTALLSGPTFEGPLRPLIALPEEASGVSFGPRGVLVRGTSGQRWMIELPSGAIGRAGPPGVVDLAALPDGRAAALAEGARLFVSVDRGARWNDATASVYGAPQAISAHGGEIWIADDAGHFFRLDPGGVPREIDAIPHPPEDRVRPRDPGWHGSEAPFLAAVRRGAALGDGSAIVAVAGDVARVDLRTGATRILAAGRLPPELPCETLRTSDDVIAVCALHGKPSVVVAHLPTGAPVLERTFPVDGPFYAGEDGALVFGGSCDGAKMAFAACARDARGEWSEHGVPSPPDAGAGAGSPPVVDGGADAGPQVDLRRMVRWVPREGAPPLGIGAGMVPGVYDPVSGVSTPWRFGDEVRVLPVDVERALGRDPAGILDRRWSARAPGVLRGWLEKGQVLHVTAEGQMARSAFTYGKVAASGPFALAEGPGGRLFQTTDAGESWTEVAPPSPPQRGPSLLTLPRCSPVGCEVGLWVRLGWDPTPPAVAAVPEPHPVTPAPRLPRTPLREITCSPTGSEILRRRLSPGFDDEPGLGAHPALVVSRRNPDDSGYRRRFFSRARMDPAHGLTAADGSRALRALAHGWPVEFSAGSISVLGPSRSPGAYRHLIDFWEPFDPDATIRQVSFGIHDLLAAAAHFGAPLAELFGDAPELDGITAILPADPAGATGLVFTIPTEAGQMVGTITGGSTARLRLWGGRLDAEFAGAVSAVELPGGEVAVLMITADDARDVYSAGAGGVAHLHHVPSFQQRELAPASPDALAVGPGGSLAVLATPSGAEPPTADDPAILFPLPSGTPVILAPWSTLTAADDPACLADVAGYRAIVQTAGPWVRVRPSAPAHAPVIAAMTARVRWSASRVCLEAIEIPDGSRNVRAGDDLETVVVARFSGKQRAAARVGHVPGVEARQPLSCALVPP